MGRIFITGFFAAVFLLTARSTAAETTPPSEWVARSWQTEDGLPQNTVNAIAQTRDGFLWIGTSGGLARFDGLLFRKFGLQDGLKSVRISTLAEDTQGILWIGTTGGGVSCWDHGRLISFGTAEGFPSGADVVSMAAGRDGSIWIGTTEGLVREHHRTFTRITPAEGLPQDQVRALAQDSGGALWVSMLPGGIFRENQGRFIRPEGSGLVPDGVYSLEADNDGGMWAGAGNGLLWHWHAGTWKRFDTTDGLPLASFMSLDSDRDGTLWIAAEDRGLYRSRGNRFEPATKEGELSDANIGRVTVDREGVVWVGTRAGGLNRLSRRDLQYWGSSAGLPSTSVTSVAADAAGTWWVGMGSAGIYRFSEGRFEALQDPAVSKHTHRIYTLTSAADGSIWAAGEGCLYRFRPGEPTRAFLEAPVRGEAVRALCADGNTLWMGTYYSTLLKCDGDTVRVAAPRGSFGGDITSIVSDGAGTLWIGSSGGLHRWANGKIVRTWNANDGLLTSGVRSLLLEPDGTLWIGTMGGGLARLKNGHIVNITTHQGLTDDVISQIVEDGDGFLWLGGNRGVMRIARQELEAVADGRISTPRLIAFGKDEGMLKEQCVGGHSPTAMKTPDGHLLFPTVNGIAEFDPHQLHHLASNPPHTVIDSIFVDGQPKPLEGELVIPPGRHRLDVNFTAPGLHGGAGLRFYHRLDGLDTDWGSESAERSVSYDGLRPGPYVLHVAASDETGRWNGTIASLSLTVQPQPWQTIWFLTGSVLLLIAAVGSLVWWYVHRRHQRQLAALERSRLHEAEFARVSRVSLLGELSASLAHELNQPLAAILGNAQAALRFLNDDNTDLNEIRECLRDIVVADRRASEIISRMRAMMKKGEAQLEPRDINADIEQVLALLHSDLVTRQVTVATRLHPELPFVDGDHIQLQQVLLNLIVNGCDAMRDKPPEERHLLIATARENGNMVRVSVIDQGTGIAPELLERIFEPFYSTKSQGLGMGLAICGAIIKAHGGRFWATNNPARGAAFHFTLRIEDEA